MSNNTENMAIETKPTEKLTMDYVLEQIEKIATETEYLHNAISELSKTNSGGPGDVGTQEKAHALGGIVTSREQTNQRLLSLYEKMYDDLKAQSLPNERERIIDTMLESLGNRNVSRKTQDAIVDILATSLQDLSKNI